MKHDFSQSTVASITDAMEALKTQIENTDLSLEDMPFSWRNISFDGAVQWAEIFLIKGSKDKLSEPIDKAISAYETLVGEVDGFDSGTAGSMDELLSDYECMKEKLAQLVEGMASDFSARGSVSNLRNLMFGIDSKYDNLDFEDLSEEEISSYTEYVTSIEIDEENAHLLENLLIQNVGGQKVYNEDLICEYLKKSPGELSDAEQNVLVDTIANLKDTCAYYDSLASVGDDEAGVDIGNVAAWSFENQQGVSTSFLSAHYNNTYLNILNFLAEASGDQGSIAFSLLNFGDDNSSTSVLGVEAQAKLNAVTGNASFKAYLLKYQTEHSEAYFLEGELEAKSEIKSSNDVNMKNAEKYLKDHDLLEKENETIYLNEDGEEIKQKDAPAFYDREATILEGGVGGSASVSIFDYNYQGDRGSASVTVGEAEAHANATAGFYVIGPKGERLFSPGVRAEIGASVTAFEAKGEYQLLGNEMIGMNVDGTVTAGKAEAKADATVQIFGSDGKVDMQFGASASAEAIAGEVEGSVGVNVLGGEVGVKGGVNFGIGAHADVGYRDGVFKCDVGASLGLGVSVDVEVDVGGMVDTVCDKAEAAWDAAEEKWDDIKDGWNDFWSW